jgi:hypothetical protein
MGQNLDALKAFLTMGFKLVNVVEALEDGFQLGDLGQIVAGAKAIPGGLKSAQTAWSQYVSMSDEEALPLEDWVVANFDIKNDVVEQGIEQSLKVVIELHSFAALLAPKKP